jgi:hypothetical protein
MVLTSWTYPLVGPYIILAVEDETVDGMHATIRVLRAETSVGTAIQVSLGLDCGTHEDTFATTVAAADGWPLMNWADRGKCPVLVVDPRSGRLLGEYVVSVDAEDCAGIRRPSSTARPLTDLAKAVEEIERAYGGTSEIRPLFPVPSRKAGRNAACPCGAVGPEGARVKYKRCCGR